MQTAKDTLRIATSFSSFAPLALIIPLFSLFLSAVASAESPKEQYQKIQKEMELRKNKLEETKRLEYSVFEELDVANKRLAAVETELRRQRSRLRKTEAELREVVAGIASNREELDKKKTWLKRKLRGMQRHGQSYELLVLLTSTDDVAQIMRRWKYLESITAQERRIIDGYIVTLEKLEEREQQLRELRADLKKGEERIRLTEATIDEKRKVKEHLLASVRSEKSVHEKMLRELRETSKRLRDMLRKLEEKEIYEAKGFSASRGKLAWPVNGKVAIPFGSQRDPRFNTPVFRNGIYIRADDDSSIKAVYGGKVVFADWFKGYGNLLIVNHGEGYHTLYANLSEIFFNVGDIIKISDIVGRVGESGILNAPSLYFEIRYRGKPLDPAQWLKRR